MAQTDDFEATQPDTAADAVRAEGEEFSKRIRKLRNEKGISLREMAERSGVSISFLSQVENGKASPSIPTLIKMAHALDEQVATLFEPRTTSRLIRKAERPKLVHPKRSWSEELLSPRDFRSLQLVLSKVAPGGHSAGDTYGYEAAETCALVMEGEVEFQLDGEPLQLAAGDCLAFDSSSPHRVANNGDAPAVILWVSSPPAY